MLDFELEDHEWQKNMRVIMQDINLAKINISNDFMMTFEFLNSNDGKSYKKIICHSVWKLSSDISLSTDDKFPFFICDIRVIRLEKDDIEFAFDHYCFGFAIPEAVDYNLLCIESGEVSISLICKKIEILDM